MPDPTSEKVPTNTALTEPAPLNQSDKKPEEPKFDKWDLSEDVRTLLLELAKTEDKARIEEIINNLHNEHKVPKELMKEVLTAEQGFWSNTWQLIKSGSWHQSSLDDQGNVKTTFKLDSKGIGWETEDMAVGFDISKTKAYYKDKDDKWAIEAGQSGGDTFVGTAIGEKETGLHEGKVYGSGGSDKLKVGAEYGYTEGTNKYSGGAEYKQDKGTHTIGGKYSQTEGPVTHEGTAEVYLGDTKGGAASYHYKDTNAKEGEKPKPGETVDVTISGSAKVEENKEKQDTEKATVNLKTGVQAGGTTVNLGYTHIDDTQEGQTFQVNSMDLKVGQNINLAEAKDLKLEAGGNLTLDEHEGKETTFKLNTSATYTTGTGDNKESVNLTLSGGKQGNKNVASALHLDPTLLNDQEGYGGYGKLGISHTQGGKTIGGEVGVGTAGEANILGGKGYYKSKELNLEILGAAAQQDDQLSGLLQSTATIAVTNNVSLQAGGKVVFKPTDQGYDQLWQTYAGAGIKFDKNKTLSVKMGIASDGSQIAYIPELSFEMDKKFKITALGSFSPGRDPSVGAKLDLGKSAFSVIGGYGDPSLMANPHFGSPGISVPGMDASNVLGHQKGQGYIMIQCDLIKLGRQLFGK
ncbi:MAG: hypothetical protein JW797_18675 [Bradymonadales bacterium]|nr:hypothetical protein [Bradymonadales bacterium]